jgi:hypothetical protein
MRSKTLVTIAGAFFLSTVSAPLAASAAPSPSDMKKAGEIKDPAKADAAIAKDEATDAKKQAHVAHKKAKVAANKAHKAEKKADEGAKSSG